MPPGRPRAFSAGSSAAVQKANTPPHKVVERGGRAARRDPNDDDYDSERRNNDSDNDDSEADTDSSETSTMLDGHANGNGNGLTTNGDTLGAAQHHEGTPLLLAKDGKRRPHHTYSFKKEFISLWALTLPMWMTYTLEFAISGITVVVTGHLGTTELNAAAIGQLLINTTTIAPLVYGLTAALDTLATQAYTSSNPKTTSLYVQRTAVLIGVCLVPCFVLLSFAEQIFLILRQDPEVARLAGQYVRVFMVAIPFLATFELLRRWLLAQGLVNVPTYALLVAVPVCILLNWLLVLGPPAVRIGFLGAPLASVITDILMLLLLVIYVIFWAPRDAHGGFTSAAFRDLGPNIRLGIAGIVTVCSEWLAWDLVSLASSYLGQVPFAANQIAVVISVTLFQLPYAMTVAAGIRIGNLLGAQKAQQAKFASLVVCYSGLLMGILNSSAILIARTHVGYIFSEDEAVVTLLADVVPLIALFQIGDDITGATQGILRGAGLANLAARANIAAYYFLGIPIAFVLAFKLGWGLKGLWTGYIFALCLNALLNTLFVLKVDWRAQARKAREQADATESFLRERRAIDAEQM